MNYAIFIITMFLFLACQQGSNTITSDSSSKEISTKNTLSGNQIATRFKVPTGFKRVVSPKTSFAHYLQNLPLKPIDSPVHYFDGSPKQNQSVHAGVIDIDVEKRDLQQCADAVMRLRAEYLYQQKRFSDIHFNYTNGFEAKYEKWRKGYRIEVNGNKVTWVKTANPSDSYEDFRKYLTQVFIYAGTLSLEKELHSVDLSDVQIGDVLIQGGSPGHAVIVVDLAVHPTTNEKRFLLAQSYMPAQDIHILKCPNQKSPWYSNLQKNQINTPEWTFQTTDLRRF